MPANLTAQYKEAEARYRAAVGSDETLGPVRRDQQRLFRIPPW